MRFAKAVLWILALTAMLCIGCTTEKAKPNLIIEDPTTTATQPTTVPETVPETPPETIPAATKPLTYDSKIDFSQLPDGTTPPTKPTEPKPTKPETDVPTTTPTTPTEKPDVPETETTEPTDAPPAATEPDGYQSVVVRP